MQPSLIETKLQIPPVRPGLLPRERLAGQVDLHRGLKLILVSAPAGYGKTTLFSSWSAQQTGPVAWFSIDEGDNDPVRFLSYLIGALQCVEQSIGQAALALLQAPPISITGTGPSSGGDPFEGCLGALIEDLLWTPDPLTIILDDYHLIRTESIHRMLRRLLELQPEQLRLVISAREDPPLNLPRLRARNQVVEVRERELRFTRDEAASFLNPLNLSAQSISILEMRTEGWPAGLQLAALSLQKTGNAEDFIRAFAGDDRQVADYLLDEVFRYQPAEVQDFLLHTSVLAGLSGPLCDVLLQGWGSAKQGQFFLEELDAAQLFLIPLDNKRVWYRYHHLFADFLRARLRKTYPERLADLHARASQWYEATGNVPDAVEHAFAVPDNERVIYLLEQNGTILVFGGQLTTFLDWIKKIPPEEIFEHVHLCVDCSWAFALSGQLDLAGRFARAGKKAIPSAAPVYIASRGKVINPAEVLGDLTSVQAYCARLLGDSEEVRHYSHEALQQLPPDAYTVRGVVALNLGLDYYQSWEWEAARKAFVESAEMVLKANENIYVAIVALCMQGSIQIHRGSLDEAGEYFRKAIVLGEENAVLETSAIPATCLAYHGLAEIHYLRNEIEDAGKALETALELARQAGNTDMLYNIYQLGAWLALLDGNVPQAEKAIQKAEQHFPRVLDLKSDPDITALQAAFLLRQGKSRAAIESLNERGISATGLAQLDENAKYTWKHIYGYLLMARALLLEKQTKDALQVVETLLPIVEACEDVNFLIEAHLLIAVLEDQRNDAQRARAMLGKVLQLSEPSGTMSPFLNLGQPLYEFIRREILSGGLKSEFAQKILAAFAGQSRRGREGLLTESDLSSGVEALTRQESQILQLLARGLSSTEVAEELVIAVSTARSYIKSIHRKLDAHSREAAIACGKQLGLI